MQLHSDIPIIKVWLDFTFTAVETGDDNSLLCYIMRFCPYKVLHVSEDKCVAGWKFDTCVAKRTSYILKHHFPACRSRTPWVGLEMTRRVVVVGGTSENMNPVRDTNYSQWVTKDDVLKFWFGLLLLRTVHMNVHVCISCSPL